MDFTEQVGFEKNLKVANIGVGVEEGHKKMEEFLFGRGEYGSWTGVERLIGEENHWTLEIEKTLYSDSNGFECLPCIKHINICLPNLYLPQLYENTITYLYILDKEIEIHRG